MRREKGTKGFRGHRRKQRFLHSHSVGEATASVYCRVFPKQLSGGNLAKGDLPTPARLCGQAHHSRDNEVDVAICSVPSDYVLVALISRPLALLGNCLERLWVEALKDIHPLHTHQCGRANEDLRGQTATAAGSVRVRSSFI